jgi:hypothetical protein
MKRTFITTAVLAATVLAPAPAYAAAAVVTVDPVAVQTVPPTRANGNRGHVVVSGTYRCDPSPIGTLAQLAVTLVQPPTGPGRLTNSRGINVTCTGNAEPYSIDTVGTVVPGSARYHVVLNAVPTNEYIIADGVLTVV